MDPSFDRETDRNVIGRRQLRRPERQLTLAWMMIARIAVLSELRHIAVIDDGRPVQQNVCLRSSEKLQDAFLEFTDDAFAVPSQRLHRPVQRLRVERPDAVMIPNLLPVEPRARLQNAEVIAQLVDEHATDKGIERDALALVPSDDLVQP